MKPKIFVLDATGFLFRSYFAIKGMTNEEGKSTNALFGFIRSILKLIKDFEPTHIVAVFDGPNNSAKRKALYPAYKANRSEMPKDLPEQMDWAKQFCKLMGISFLSIEGVEADDTMGTIAKWGESIGATTYLCTSDKDLCQLVSDKVYILNTHKNNLLLDPKAVEETHGVKPSQMIDYLAIMGDSSDNIPGLSGFGPKTARSLLQEHHDLDTILKNPTLLKGKKRETLIAETDQALLSRKLVTIETAVDVPHELNFYEQKKVEANPLIDFYAQMNFQSLISETSKKASQPKEKVSYQLVDDPQSLESLLKKLQEAKEICFDTETTAIRPLLAKLVGIGFAINSHEAWYIPTNGKLGEKQVLDALKPLFEDPEKVFFGHNVKYDLHVVQNYGIEIANISYDTILASYVLHAHERHHSLDALSAKYFHKTKTPISELIGTGKKQISMMDVPIEKVCDYCCEDVDYTLRLKNELNKEIQERGLKKLLIDLELPLLRVLAKMERNGIFIDIDHLKKMSKEISSTLEQLEGEIYELAGESFNIKSPKQLGHILFEKLELNPPKKTKTGYSTNAQVLEILSAIHPIAGKVIEFRTLEKLRSTYTDTLPLEVYPETGRIHCTFNQSVAATGRLSSQDPNLQNIPIRTPLGKKIRQAFKPEKPGWAFLSADYAQIELRLLAHMSQDPTLLHAFQEGEDIHTHTASNLFGIPISEVTKEMRYHAKAVNFGVLYGQGAFGLSQAIGIGRKEASEFIRLYFERYSRVKEFLDSCIEKAKDTGKAVTLTGRERALPEIHSKNHMIRQAAERLAVNTPLQGTQADLIKLAMLEVDKQMKINKIQSMLLLQIHDELLFEVPEGELEAMKTLVTKGMEGVWTLDIPLTIDISVGENWAKC